jgi:MFS family permease
VTTTAPAAPASAPSSDVLASPAGAIVFLGTLGGIQAVDPTIASTALVKASRGLGMDGGLLALAASISTLVLAATVISSCLLGDRIGWRRLLTGGLLLSIVGDVLVALAPASTAYSSWD